MLVGRRDVLAGFGKDWHFSLALLNLAKNVSGPRSRAGRTEVLYAPELPVLACIRQIGHAGHGPLQPLLIIRHLLLRGSKDWSRPIPFFFLRSHPVP